MATVTVFTSERTAEIEATSIVSGSINEDGHLVLMRHDGTPIDMGAVSGVQLDQGSDYAKADVFSYVGDTDPGAVPDGSVWFDTTGPTGPFASTTQQGLVELATTAEAAAGTDTQRAVTPAGVAAAMGTRVLAPNAVTETATPTAYPSGVSVMNLTTGSGWSVNSGFGSVMTLKSETDRTVQFFYSNPGGTGTPRQWQRHYHTSNNGGGWTAWSQVQLIATLTPGTIVQTTGHASYPNGWSRMYFSTANGTGWDFAGTPGELLTYTEGTDFAKQTFTAHASGSGFRPIIWTRTANTAAGWSAWFKQIPDQGAWISYTPTWTSQGSVQPSWGNASRNCKYIKVGRMVTVHFWINFGSTTNFGAGATSTDNWIFSLPVPAANDSDDGLGYLEMYKSATDCGWARVKMYTTSAFKLGISPGSSGGIGGDVDSVSPFVWASGNYLRGTFTYESAS
ncbi:hypothetical protein SEA_SCAP1_16 [Streptomyces phage Scap1]|uniref:Uncharacterized protein n=1 Tax=Streptomyces phage Scap1 TaxID=2041354 RepID=A0A2D1GNX4_9CAUD|nr:hypothetical protein FDI71_gp16 [Streptomyces phage Scap1]ATN93665.1 hypothetical protein SEA_SCAP1_16 [Streptomyces phage Scap1]